MSTDLQGITVQIIDELGGRRREVSLPDVIDRARDAARSGDERLAFDLLYDVADQIETTGFLSATFAVLDELRKIAPFASMSPRDRAWLLNLEGRALSNVGRPAEAREAYARMAALGEEIRDLDIIATAQQNLGVLAALGGNVGEAEQYYRSALSVKEAMKDHRAVAQLRLNLAVLAIEQGALDEAAELLTKANQAIKRARDPFLRPSLFGNRGRLAVARGDLVEARRNFRLALRRALSVGNVVSTVRSIQSLGSVSLDLGQVAEAIEWYENGLRIAETAGLQVLEEDLHRGLALAFHKAGEDTAAINHLGKVVVLADARGDTLASARATADLGALAINTGEPRRAIALLSNALGEFRQAGDQTWEGRTLGNLVTASAALGDPELAAQYAAEALAARSLSSREHAELLQRVGEAWLADLDAARAADAFNRSLAEFERTGDDGLAWEALRAAALLSRHDGEAALPFYNRALALYSRAGDSQMTFHVRNDRANALTKLGRFADARRDYEACRRLADRFDDRVMALQCFSNFGEMARREGSTDEAISLLERAVVLAQSLHDESNEASARANLGLALGNAGRWEQAKEMHIQALEMARRAEDLIAESTAVGGLAAVEFARGAYEAAATLYREASELPLPSDAQVHIVEDLAALTESVSALGREQETQQAGQRLVDLAQEIGETELAAEGLIRAADRWLKRGRTEEAISLFAAAVQVATVERSGEDERAIRAAARAIIAIVERVQASVQNAESREHILDAVTETASGGDENVTHFLHDTIGTIQEMLANRREGGDGNESSVR